MAFIPPNVTGDISARCSAENASDMAWARTVVPMDEGFVVRGNGAVPATDGEASIDLLERARAGDRRALDALIARYLPRLRRWASGRLPRWARDLADTQDLVQDTLLQTFKRIDMLEISHEGALQ